MLQRRLLHPPGYLDLDAGIRRRLENQDTELRSLRTPSAQAVRAADGAIFRPLEHPLSATFASVHPPKAVMLRSPLEAEVLADHWTALAMGSPDTFVAVVLSLATSLTGTSANVRRGHIFLGADASGTRIELTAPARVPAALAACGNFLYRHASTHPVFTAVVVLALFVNIHPLVDGNGRVARVLYNFCLKTGGLRQTDYVPFYEIAERSRGGYEIALRKAEIRRDWAALFGWCLAAHQICDHISSRVSQLK
jgi:hypothetical protein